MAGKAHSHNRSKVYGLIAILIALSVLVSAPPTFADEKSRCCFRVNISTGGFLAADYGSNPADAINGRRQVNWGWDAREIVEYVEDGRGVPTLRRRSGVPGRYNYAYFYDQTYTRRNPDGSRSDISCKSGFHSSGYAPGSASHTNSWLTSEFGEHTELRPAGETDVEEVLDDRLRGHRYLLRINAGDYPSLLDEGCATTGSHDAVDLEGLNGAWSVLLPPPSRKQFRRDNRFSIDYRQDLVRDREHECLDRDQPPGCGIQPHDTGGHAVARMRFTWFPRKQLPETARRLSNLPTSSGPTVEG